MDAIASGRTSWASWISNPNKKLAGGRFNFIPSNPLHDITPLVPDHLNVVFPKLDGGAPTADVTPYARTLNTLGMSEFNGVTGYSEKNLYSTAWANWTGGGTPANNAELSTLATTIAKAWYRWQLSEFSVSFSGIIPWTPEGFSVVRFRWDENEITTRVEGQSFDDDLEMVFHWGAAGSANIIPDASIVNLTVSNLTVTQTFTVQGTATNPVIVTYNYATIVYESSTTQIYYGSVLTPPGTSIQTSLVSQICPVVSSQEKKATGTTTINSGTYTDITGCTLTFTPAVAGDFIIIAKFPWEGGGAATPGEVFGGYLTVDGTQQADHTEMFVLHASQQIDGVVVYKITLTAASHTIKLQAKRLAGAGSIVVGSEAKMVIHADTKINMETRPFAFPVGTQMGSKVCSKAPDCCPGSDGTPGGGGGDGCGECKWCTEDPNEWTITLSGFSNLASGLDPNGAYTLTRGKGCVWSGTNAGGYKINFTVNGTYTGVLNFNLYSLDFSYSTTLSTTSDGTGLSVPTSCCHNFTLAQDFALPVPGATAPATVSIARVDCCGTALIVTACCGGAGIPPTLTATFGGSLAALGAVTLTWDGGTSQWKASPAGCGGTSLSFACTDASFPGTFQLLSGTGATFMSAFVVPDSCSPFQWTSGNMTVTTNCAGTGTCVITE